MSENKSRILVVEDDRKLLAELVHLLENAGFEVDKATTVQEAVAKSKETIHCLALIDIRLPDANGTKLIPKLPQATPSIRKIILTGYPAMDNAVEALNLGANRYLMKPVKPETLLKTIKEELRKREEESKYSQEKIEEYIRTIAAEFEKKK
jgi:two-component system response regulator HydG